MSKKKKDVRDSFRTKVFSRDKNTCRTCGDKKGPMDAHHILNRNHMPEGGQGGYVPENGITLCPACHIKAEEEYWTWLHTIGSTRDESYGPLALYRIIGSSFEKARTASLKVSNVS